jgi:hypothetical protein
MKKEHLPIGTPVKVLKNCVKDYDTENGRYIKIIEKIEPKYPYGIIVGGSYIKEGKIELEDGGVSWFEEEITYFVYLVRSAFTMKPMKVMPRDLEVLDKDDDIDIPFSGSSFQWNERERERQSSIMKRIARDERGRWL